MNVTQILTFLANIVGELTTSSSISATISFLIQIVTFATQEIQAITPEIKAIIAGAAKQRRNHGRPNDTTASARCAGRCGI